MKPLHRGFFFKKRDHDLTGNGRSPPFDDDGVSGQDAGAGHAFPSNPEGEVVREIPGIGDFYREIPLRVFDGLFETAGGNFTQEGDWLKAARGPVRSRERQLFGQAIATGPARLLDEASLFDKSGEMGPDGLDGPETEVPLHLAKGRGVPLQETVAHEVENSIPGLSRRGFGHAYSIADICLVCQERRPVLPAGAFTPASPAQRAKLPRHAAAWPSPPHMGLRHSPQERRSPTGIARTAGETRDVVLPYGVARHGNGVPLPVRSCAMQGHDGIKFRCASRSDAGRRPALQTLKGNFVDVVARVYPAGSPGVRLFPLPA